MNRTGLLLVAAVALLCLTQCRALPTEDSSIQPSESEEHRKLSGIDETQLEVLVLVEQCSVKTYCPEGHHCCTAATCCPKNVDCCGDGLYCCNNQKNQTLYEENPMVKALRATPIDPDFKVAS